MSLLIPLKLFHMAEQSKFLKHTNLNFLFRIGRFCANFKSFDKDESLYSIIKQAVLSTYVDNIKQTRQARLFQYSSQMDTETYALFSNARRRSICLSHRR